jgi:hypothetical protein
MKQAKNARIHHLTAHQSIRRQICFTSAFHLNSNQTKRKQEAQQTASYDALHISTAAFLCVSRI